jgi:hypothetical protein
MHPETLGPTSLLTATKLTSFADPSWKRPSCLQGETVHGINYNKYKKENCIPISIDFSLPGQLSRYKNYPRKRLWRPIGLRDVEDLHIV